MLEQRGGAREVSPGADGMVVIGEPEGAVNSLIGGAGSCGCFPDAAEAGHGSAVGS